MCFERFVLLTHVKIISLNLCAINHTYAFLEADVICFGNYYVQKYIPSTIVSQMLKSELSKIINNLSIHEHSILYYTIMYSLLDHPSVRYRF